MKARPDSSASMHIELGAEISGKLREAPQVFVEVGRITVFLAEKDLVINQVEQQVVVEVGTREFLEKGLDGQPFSIAPALAMLLQE